MGFQKCPSCGGSGLDQYSIGLVPCPVCKGARIIDEVTGMPPRANTFASTGVSVKPDLDWDVMNNKTINKS